MGRLAIAVATAAMLAASCGGTGPAAQGSPQGGRDMMSDARDKAIQALTLKDEEYFGITNPRKTELSLRLSSLFPKGPQTPPGPPEVFLVAGAPRKVPLDRRHEVPLLVGIRTTGRREWEVHREQNSVVVLADLKTGAVETRWPFIKGKRRETPEPSASGPEPDKSEALTVMTGIERIDLRELFDRTWPTTRLAVRVLIHDWASNSAVIDIEKEGPLPAESKPRKPSDLAAPSAVKGPGASLEVSANASAAGPILIKGSVDLEADSIAVAPLEGSPDASVLLATVLFRKLDNEDPVQIDLAARAERQESKGVRRVRAGFEFDASKALKGQSLNGTYQVYLVAGAALAGPYPLTVAP